MARDEPQVSVGGFLGLGKGKHNSLRILPKYGKELEKKRKGLRQEGRCVIEEEVAT